MRLAAAIAAAVLAATTASAATVHTQQGDVSGVVAGKVESFKGVPFAAPPVGEARWRPTGPAPAWTGVKAADAFGPICMQGRRFSTAQSMSEDCLTLNVWRPPAPRPATVCR